MKQTNNRTNVCMRWAWRTRTYVVCAACTNTTIRQTCAAMPISCTGIDVAHVCRATVDRSSCRRRKSRSHTQETPTKKCVSLPRAAQRTALPIQTREFIVLFDFTFVGFSTHRRCCCCCGCCCCCSFSLLFVPPCCTPKIEIVHDFTVAQTKRK